MQHTILLTGASGGIGQAIARTLAGPEYNLALCYNNNKEETEKLATLCQEKGSSCMLVHTDFASGSPINKNTFEEIASTLGAVDIIINNAGVSLWGLITDVTEEEWDKLFHINVKSAFLTTKYGLPSMIQNQFGRIINISSMWGQVGASCEVAYSATKGALISMTKALAQEVGPSGITVNCIAPGLIDTPMNSALTPETVEELREATPVGRVGTPEDVASMVKYLISPEASFITGQIIGVNGGFVIV